MIELTQDQIKEINNKCPNDHGIFNEPYGIPDNIKGLIIYGRFETGGVSGGSCWDDSENYNYTNDIDDYSLKALELALEILKPDITFLQYKKIDKLIIDNEETEYEYYGNSTDYKIKFIELEKLYKFLIEL